MRSVQSLVNIVLVPALTGLSVALAVLLWLPGAMSPSHNETSTTGTYSATDTSLLPSAQGPVSYADAVDRAAPAVVNIFTRKIVRRKTHPLFDDPFFQRFFRTNPQPSERIQSSLGSGVIMSADGYILTNNHVINGADQIVVALHDGRDVNATIVGTDPEADLAVLKIDLQELPYIQVAQNRQLRIGDVVLAIGNPFGVGQTVTLGIVSATGRNQLGINTYEDYIQTDAAINPGNSGGALINAHGELVGLNTAIFSKSGGSQGIGFAIPAAVATRTLTDIATHGTTIRGWLGIEVQESTPQLLEALGLTEALTGLIVTGIYPDGPADKAKLAIGDILTHINGEEAANARHAMNQIAALRPGDDIDLEFIRAGQVATTRATAGLRESHQPQ
ncbi:trypsin-like peptidase domain-containing protein [Thalassolituus marinus]|uniref:Trypsin-like peptidase domain-containing protein n=1 Tax=Thalassolituus marinus TaxID=671053 RepID=A0ABS7ZQR5_9GAMM|nr:trypsin-like peptidase domain-containing protein [Thalassolituus marinus]MCA6063407.1 trypsin-like peptidase domain-containing protein [Thalassolituus marinus]